MCSAMNNDRSSYSDVQNQIRYELALQLQKHVISLFLTKRPFIQNNARNSYSDVPNQSDRYDSNTRSSSGPRVI